MEDCLGIYSVHFFFLLRKWRLCKFKLEVDFAGAPATALREEALLEGWATLEGCDKSGCEIPGDADIGDITSSPGVRDGMVDILLGWGLAM